LSESAEQVLFRNMANNPNHVFAYTKDDNHASLFDDFEPECLDPIWQKKQTNFHFKWTSET